MVKHNLVVIDYSTATVHFFNYKEKDGETLEEYVESLHKLNLIGDPDNCSWMSSDETLQIEFE